MARVQIHVAFLEAFTAVLGLVTGASHLLAGQGRMAAGPFDVIRRRALGAEP